MLTALKRLLSTQDQEPAAFSFKDLPQDKLHPSFALQEQHIQWEQIKETGICSYSAIDSLEHYKHLTLLNSSVHLVLNQDQSPSETFSSKALYAAHEATFKHIHPWAGENRTTSAMQFGTQTSPPSKRLPLEMAVLDEQMKDLLTQAKTPEKKLEAVAFYHAKTIALHPFLDGNGRSTRSVMALQLMSVGLQPNAAISTLAENKKDYIKALDLAIKDNDVAPLANLIGQSYGIKVPKPSFAPYEIKPSQTAPQYEVTLENIKTELKRQSNYAQVLR